MQILCRCSTLYNGENALLDCQAAIFKGNPTEEINCMRKRKNHRLIINHGKTGMAISEAMGATRIQLPAAF